MKHCFIVVALFMILMVAETGCTLDDPSSHYSRVVTTVYNADGCAFLLSWNANGHNTPSRSSKPMEGIKALSSSVDSFDSVIQRFPDSDKSTCVIKPTGQ